MKRASLLLVALSATAACGHSPSEIEAWCSRYAAKHMSYGQHDDLNRYREDLMSSCMAMKGVPYAARTPAAGGTQTAKD